LLLSSCFNCNQIGCRELFQFSYIYWGLFCDLRYDLVWKKFHGLLRRMYILVFLDKIFCRHQVHLFMVSLSSRIFCWFFVWMTYLLVIEEY
jgi:hypothetical protein